MPIEKIGCSTSVSRSSERFSDFDVCVKTKSAVVSCSFSSRSFSLPYLSARSRNASETEAQVQLPQRLVQRIAFFSQLPFLLPQTGQHGI